MKTKSNSKKTAIVFVGSYTSSNIQDIVSRRSIYGVHYLIQDWSIYPQNNAPYRADLELVEFESRDHVRRANLLELIHFALRHPEIVLEHGPIAGGDQYLESMGKDLKIPLVIPYVAFSGNKILVSVDNSNSQNKCAYKLVVTHLRYSPESPTFCY